MADYILNDMIKKCQNSDTYLFEQAAIQFARIVEVKMEQKNISASTLSKRTGFSRSKVKSILYANEWLTQDIISKIAAALEMTEEGILGTLYSSKEEVKYNDKKYIEFIRYKFEEKALSEEINKHIQYLLYERTLDSTEYDAYIGRFSSFKEAKEEMFKRGMNNPSATFYILDSNGHYLSVEDYDKLLADKNVEENVNTDAADIDTFLRRFGRKLKQLRGRMSLDKASNEMHLSKSFLWELEKGRKNPSLSNVILLARYYNVSVDFLLNEEADCTTSDKICNRVKRLSESDQKKVLELLNILF